MRDIEETSQEDCLKSRLNVKDLFQTAPSTDAQNSIQLAIMIDELHNFLNAKRYKQKKKLTSSLCKNE